MQSRITALEMDDNDEQINSVPFRYEWLEATQQYHAVDVVKTL